MAKVKWVHSNPFKLSAPLPVPTVPCSIPTQSRWRVDCPLIYRPCPSIYFPSLATSSTVPQGVGALYVRPGVDLMPLLAGGGQEFGLRSGTPAVPIIAGFGIAAELAATELPQENCAVATAARSPLLPTGREFKPDPNWRSAAAFTPSPSAFAYLPHPVGLSVVRTSFVR